MYNNDMETTETDGRKRRRKKRESPCIHVAITRTDARFFLKKKKKESNEPFSSPPSVKLHFSSFLFGLDIVEEEYLSVVVYFFRYIETAAR